MWLIRIWRAQAQKSILDTIVKVDRNINNNLTVVTSNEAWITPVFKHQIIEGNLIEL